MLQETNVPVIQKAVMVIHKMSADEKMQEIARMREKALHDEASAIQGARDERDAEIAKNMRAAGFSESDIKKALGS